MASKSDSKTMRCSYCGTEVEVSPGSSGTRVSCCGEPMKATGGGGNGGGKQEGSSSRQRTGHGT
jgi:hypothetical protein